MHKHKHDYSHVESTKHIKLAFLLNLIFSVIELFGAFITNSVSILSDAIHDFGDSLSIGISYLLEKVSTKHSNNKYTYGYLRYSLVGALFTSIMLLIGVVVVFYKSIPLLFEPSVVNHDAMIVFAIFGTLINGYAAYKTSHGHSKNEKAISLHMLEDVLGWIAVLIGSIIIKFTGWTIIDPILSILIAIYILYHVYENLREIFYIFMDKVPNDIDVNSVKKSIEKKFTDIKEVHHIHVWSIDGVSNYMTAHIVLAKDLSKDKIISLKKDVKNFLNELNIIHSTLEIEYHTELCESNHC